MTDALARRFVKPALPGADIPDPDHGNMALPQAGAEVLWNAYWIGQLLRGEILVVEPETTAASAPSAEAPPTA